MNKSVFKKFPAHFLVALIVVCYIIATVVGFFAIFPNPPVFTLISTGVYIAIWIFILWVVLANKLKKISLFSLIYWFFSFVGVLSFVVQNYYQTGNALIAMIGYVFIIPLCGFMYLEILISPMGIPLEFFVSLVMFLLSVVVFCKIRKR